MQLTYEFQVADIRDHFDQGDSPVSDDSPTNTDGLSQGSSHEPMLLEGLRAKFSLPVVLADVPPKHIADRLVSRYFNSTQNSIGTYCYHSYTTRC